MIRLTLSRGDLVLLSTGLILAGGMVFVAGSVVGFELGPGPEGVAGSAPEASGAMVACAEPTDPGAAEPAGDPTPVVRTAGTSQRPPSGMVGAGESLERAATAPSREPASASVSASAVDPSTDDAPDRRDSARGGDEAGTRAFAVQVGAFSVPRNASELADRLRERGYDPMIVRARNRSGAWLELVRLSVHPTERRAALEARRFADAAELPAIVVPTEHE